MKLINIDIQGYRSLFATSASRSFSLDLADGMNCIVGPNNCGKSNIFRALAVALDPEYRFDRKKDMPAQWIWSKPVITLTFQVGTRSTSSEKTLLRHLEAYEMAANPAAKATFAAARVVKYRVTIEGGEDSVGTRRETFVASGAGARSLPADNPLSVKALAQFKRCFHFVYIESGQSLSSLLEGKFREILRSVLRDHLSAQFADVEANRSKYVESIQSGLLDPLTQRIQAELKDLFPEITAVELRPEVQGLDDSLTRMRVNVTDSAVTDLAEKGTGVRGGVIVSILRHLADEGRRSMLFAVEEPEAFLHPGAQECLRDDLEGLAKRADVSLLVATHSPFVVSRKSHSKVFAVKKDGEGRTVLVTTSPGDKPQAGLLGSLFQNQVLADVLDRSSSIGNNTKAVLVVEGYTDKRFLDIADSLLPGASRIADIAIICAGSGLGDGNSGGAALAVVQALLSKASSGLPVVVLLDNDDEGEAAATQLRKISEKTGDWNKGKTLLQYSDAIPNATSGQFPWEAEDLWPEALVATFVASVGNDEAIDAKRARPKNVGGWKYSIRAQFKAPLLEHVEATAKAGDAVLWAALINKVRAGAGLSAVP